MVDGDIFDAELQIYDVLILVHGQLTIIFVVCLFVCMFVCLFVSAVFLSRL